MGGLFPLAPPSPNGSVVLAQKMDVFFGPASRLTTAAILTKFNFELGGALTKSKYILQYQKLFKFANHVFSP